MDKLEREKYISEAKKLRRANQKERRTEQKKKCDNKTHK
jgi:hypothetical protein